MARKWADACVAAAREALVKTVFEARVDEVFFERQLQVRFEHQFFHWITSKALHELSKERKIQTVLMPLLGETRIRFYWSMRLRSWKRLAKKARKLVQQYSTSKLATALISDHCLATLRRFRPPTGKKEKQEL